MGTRTGFESAAPKTHGCRPAMGMAPAISNRWTSPASGDDRGPGVIYTNPARWRIRLSRQDAIKNRKAHSYPNATCRSSTQNRRRSTSTSRSRRSCLWTCRMHSASKGGLLDIAGADLARCPRVVRTIRDVIAPRDQRVCRGLILRMPTRRT